MKRKLYLLICVLFLLYSCKKDVKIRVIGMQDSLFQTIVIDPKEFDNLEEPAKISKIATDLQYIPLQTEDSILIGQIEKLIVWNNKYYIWDKLSEAIFCFDAKGKHLYRLYGQGQGPEEYLRIRNFTMDMSNGDIYIHSDMSRAIFVYTEKGKFIRKIPIPFILTSFAVQNDLMLYYLGRMPNIDFYKNDYPNQYRYVVVKNGEPIHQQLHYIYDEKYTQIALSNNNFSYYKDTILFAEYLKPEIYAIDSTGVLKPKYRIEFLSNTYSPSFDTELDVERMNRAKNNGELAMLFGGFYETDNYLFFNYSWGVIGTVYVDKRDGSIHNMGYLLIDDINKYSLSTTLNFVDEDYMYNITEPDLLLKGKSKDIYSPYLQKIADKIQETDNPVIVKIQLKK